MFSFFFFSSRRRHTRFDCDWSSDVCSSDLGDADRVPGGGRVTTMPRKVAVIGAGDIGCGWAALCASAGWPGTVFDPSAPGLGRAAARGPARTPAPGALERATHGSLGRGVTE